MLCLQPVAARAAVINFACLGSSAIKPLLAAARRATRSSLVTNASSTHTMGAPLHAAPSAPQQQKQSRPVFHLQPLHQGWINDP
jgi:hypothetical protein